MKATITIGISASGKSYWANQQPDIININRDELRWEVSGKTGWKEYKFSRQVEDRVTQICQSKIFTNAVAPRADIIISDTNLNPVFRNKLIKTLKDYGYEVEIKEFPISFQEACRRDKGRGVFAVGEAVLGKQWEQWLKYWEDKQGSNW